METLTRSSRSLVGIEPPRSQDPHSQRTGSVRGQRRSTAENSVDDTIAIVLDFHVCGPASATRVLAHPHPKPPKRAARGPEKPCFAPHHPEEDTANTPKRVASGVSPSGSALGISLAFHDPRVQNGARKTLLAIVGTQFPPETPTIADSPAESENGP